MSGAGRTLSFVVGGAQGTYSGMPATRNHEVRLRGAWAPSRVTVVTSAGAAVAVAVEGGRNPSRACGRLDCGAAAAAASWWWDAQALTAFVRVADVDAATGVSLEIEFDTTLHHVLLHSPSATPLPAMIPRALAVKRAVDNEYFRGALPSIALNRLAATADRMQVAPESAAAELLAFDGHLRGAIAIHTNSSGTEARLLPSQATQAWLVAMLGGY